MTVVYFLCAVGFLTLGHICKAVRWRRFVGLYEATPLSTLLGALASGYLVSFYLPLHAGELLRLFLSGRKMKNGYAYALATIAVDRFLDVVCVGLLFLLLTLVDGAKSTLSATLGYLILSVALLALLLLMTRRSRLFKKTALTCCSVFNEHIKFRLLFFLWSLITSFRDLVRTIDRKKLLRDTLIMWSAYCASYYMLSRMFCSLAVPTDFVDVFRMMFDSGALLHSTFAVTDGIFPLRPELLLCAYILLPLPLLMLPALFVRKRGAARSPNRRLLPHLRSEEQLQFLNAYFEGDRREAMHEFLTMNADACILRDCSSGSDATTMLCMTDHGTVYRKYAFGAAPAEKLDSQVRWLREQADALPLPQICGERHGHYSFRYDMPCDNSAVNFFEYIHSHPLAESESILSSVLQTLRAHLYPAQAPAVDAETVDRYVAEKVHGNLRAITQSKILRPLAEAETLVINGVTYRGLPQLRCLFDAAHLREIFGGDPLCIVHGDLTIENIICRTDRNDFYLIDPNPDNPIKTPALDYAKLLQSLHGGYEYLRYARADEVDGNTVTYLLPDGERYRCLFRFFEDWMQTNLDFRTHRSVYYHEIVHWLRLLPYRLRKNEHEAVRYFAAMILVMNDVYDRYEKESV